MKNAIGLIELSSIAKGFQVTDKLVKAADSQLVESHSVCPGKFIVLITGLVGDVEKSIDAGMEIAGHALVQKLLIPNIHSQLVPALRGLAPVEELQALGIVETFSAASTIIAADAAAKKADVQLIDVRLANALGGKGYFTLTGTVEDVNSAVDAGCETIKEDGILIERVVIPRPDPAMRSAVL